MPTVKYLKEMARQLGVANLSSLKKMELIRNIQKAEGHDDCYGKIPNCGQDDCLFRTDCLKEY